MRKSNMNNDSQQRRIGVILSYILLALNMIVGIIITPIIVGNLGDREYGLHQTIASFANNLAVLDFGIGTTITRFLSKYKAKNDTESQNAVLYSIAKLTCGLSAIVLLLGVIILFFIPRIYSNTLEDGEIQRAQTVFIILVINVALTMFDHYCIGVCSSNEKFQYINTNKIIKVLLRVTLIVVILPKYSNAIALSRVDLFITIVFLFIDILYVTHFLKIRLRKVHVSSLLLKEIVVFGLTIFLQAFVNQANSNVDKILLGALSSAEVVVVYSIAMQIFIIFNSLSSVISSVYLPFVTKRIHSGVTNKEIEELIIRPGRKQFMIAGLALVGFIAIGKDFIRLWMGDNYIGAWVIAIIIMVPSMIELVENIAISVTLALGKNGVRTAIISCAALFNIISTIIFIKLFGPIGAPIATALSYLLGYIIGVNIFYKKALGINVLHVYKCIVSRTWICFLCVGLASIPLKLINTTNYLLLFGKALWICVFFLVFMLLYGFDQQEKEEIKKVFFRIRGRNCD